MGRNKKNRDSPEYRLMRDLNAWCERFSREIESPLVNRKPLLAEIMRLTDTTVSIQLKTWSRILYNLGCVADMINLPVIFGRIPDADESCYSMYIRALCARGRTQTAQKVLVEMCTRVDALRASYTDGKNQTDFPKMNTSCSDDFRIKWRAVSPIIHACMHTANGEKPKFNTLGSVLRIAWKRNIVLKDEDYLVILQSMYECREEFFGTNAISKEGCLFRRIYVHMRNDLRVISMSLKQVLYDILTLDIYDKEAEVCITVGNPDIMGKFRVPNIQLPLYRFSVADAKMLRAWLFDEIQMASKCVKPLTAFKEWLVAHSRPLQGSDQSLSIDYVIDGANVGHYKRGTYNAKNRFVNFDYSQIADMVNLVLSWNKRPLVILHEAYTKPLVKQSKDTNRDFLKWLDVNGMLYITPYAYNDDWFMMYAAATCVNSKCITNDCLRDHLLHADYPECFKKWCRERKLAYDITYVDGVRKILVSDRFYTEEIVRVGNWDCLPVVADNDSDNVVNKHEMIEEGSIDTPVIEWLLYNVT